MKARVTAHKDYTVAKIDDRVYSAFLEHLGRAIYTGIYEPDHPTADKNGMRGDVADIVREYNCDLEQAFLRIIGFKPQSAEATIQSKAA